MVPRALAVELLDMDPRNPEYIGRLARWTRANSGRVEAIYLSPSHPEVADYLAEAVAQIASRFAVDGIHLAGLQYPGRDFDYSRRTLELFRTALRRTLPKAEATRLNAIRAIDPFAYAEERAEDWRRFRITRLTGLVTRLRTTVRAIRPETMVTASVVAGAERALSEHLQDWRTWLDNRFVDALAGGRAASSMLLFSYEALLDPASALAVVPDAADGTQ
jgi:uncharacterized lipoprotein YddW (UPF0748 family)